MLDPATCAEYLAWFLHPTAGNEDESCKQPIIEKGIDHHHRCHVRGKGSRHAFLKSQSKSEPREIPRRHPSRVDLTRKTSQAPMVEASGICRAKAKLLTSGDSPGAIFRPAQARPKKFKGGCSVSQPHSIFPFLFFATLHLLSQFPVCFLFCSHCQGLSFFRSN